jgi:RimJ/RimL family protein N-acetyltransferase
VVIAGCLVGRHGEQAARVVGERSRARSHCNEGVLVPRSGRICGRVPEEIRTERLVVRDWTGDDASAAFAVYGHPEVARWLTPELNGIADDDAMGAVLADWADWSRTAQAGLGYWAVTLADSGTVVGGVSAHLLPVDEQDVEVGWQLAPEHWGRGYAVEAGRAVVGRAFANDVDEVFALVRKANRRAGATARRLGMSWVGETEKYYGLRLDIFRLRSAELV